ncbi:sensor histidine kinase [Thermomonospora amylolytica]|uniref:sensor histidine kinase n=1 Tax=Thermomonospora amylolytica TaxID=1411117 RepID=UPI000E6C03F9|nr:sensor histidine kinase [Thermomonospora amylolytica]
MIDKSPVAEDHVSYGDRKFKHKVLLYRDRERFLAGTVPFIRTGLENGGLATVALPKAETEMLREALGEDAASVQFIDATALYQNPARALAAFDAFVKALGPHRAWVVASQDWDAYDWKSLPADERAEWVRHSETVEWARYEALVNAIFSQADMIGLCCYNVEIHTPEFISQIKRSHLEITTDGLDIKANPSYTDPRKVIADLDRSQPPAAPWSAESIRVEPADLHAVRNFVAGHARRWGMAAGPLHNLMVAVTEVATHAFRRADAPITVRTWFGGDHLFCEIADSGRWRPDEFTGWAPPEAASDDEFGLWGVRMLCDSVQVRTGTEGTTVRLRNRIWPNPLSGQN